jgi:hypothetical protein
MVKMGEALTLSKKHEYDTRKPGISVKAVLNSNGGEVVCDPKIDSGSENCIFERGLGSALGFEVETGAPKRFSTVTGSFLTYGHDVTLSVLGIETSATVYFAADENFTRSVLGRQGWLDRVRMGLIDYEGKLYLSDYNESG